ncbi:MAG: T9SS type A sorting domain-containing protein [Flavobacteriaceae bacterium]|nr:T9SS type A sorting domain-containing protein [Flavobacteriaceae bacterium]
MLFDKLDRSGMQTSILFNQFLSFSEITNDSKSTFDTNGFFQAYNELAAADTQKRFLEYHQLLEAQKESYFSKVLPIGIVFTEFDVLADDAIANNDVQFINNQFIKSANSTASIFEVNRKLIAAPFNSKTVGLSPTFSLPHEYVLNTTNALISSIRIDFGDGFGFQQLSPGGQIQISYLEEGLKNMAFEVTFDSGERLYSYSSIYAKPNSAEQQNRNATGSVIPFTSTITPDLSAYGEPVNYPGEGEYQIFLDTVDGVLDKPIILVDGFDPGDGRTIAGLYSLLDFTDSMGSQNLADLVRSQGFDVVILNFPVYTRMADMAVIDGGADFIERNAMLLVDLINTINTNKTGSEQNVIIGPSMGGLISRYALNYMEDQTLDHDTRLFISFDSPHRGANVPIGVQHQLNFLAFGLGANNVVELQALVNGMLKSAAARQMLIDHMESHFMGGSTVEFDPTLLLPLAHPWKAIFDANINSLTANGFPQTVRNVSIINGSGIGNPFQDRMGGNVLPGFTLMDSTDGGTFDVALFTQAVLDVNYTPASTSGSQLVSSVVITLFGSPLIVGTANAQAFSYSDGVDAGSGGLFDLGGLGGDPPPPGLITDFLAALKADYFNFIPSLSAMALEITPNGEIDWFHDIDIGMGMPPSEAPPQRDVLNSTPFVNWHMPDDNEGHVELTEANVIFALTEINAGTLDLDDVEISSIRLEKNPIQNELTILTSTGLQDAKIKMYDLSGRLVYDLDLGQTSQRINIPVNLKSGLYIVKLTSSKGVFSTKVIIE